MKKRRSGAGEGGGGGRGSQGRAGDAAGFLETERGNRKTVEREEEGSSWFALGRCNTHTHTRTPQGPATPISFQATLTLPPLILLIVVSGDLKR